jgi:multiple sugar transport system permease protein
VIDVDTIPATEQPEVIPEQSSLGRLRRRTGRGGLHMVWWIIMLAFVLFFAVPILWLVLATTKSEHDLTTWGSLRFGSLGLLRQAWDLIWGFQSGALKSWLENSLT